MRRKNALLILLVIITFLINGCGKSSEGSSVELNLTGFPCDYTSYKVLIYLWSGEDLKKQITVGTISGSVAKNKTISITKEIDSIEVFLFDPASSYSENPPKYFWQFPVLSGVAEYIVTYWIDYQAYFSYDEIKFGISPLLARSVTSNYSANLDFLNDAPYYLYNISDVGTNELGGTVSANPGEIAVNYDNSVADVAGSNSIDYKTIYSFTIPSQQFNPLFILIRPYTYDSATNANIRLNNLYFTELSDQVIDMIASNDPHKVFAISGELTDKLIYIDPINREVTNEYTLPKDSPIALAYSEEDNKLYIAYSNSSWITVWNLDSNTAENTISYNEITVSWSYDIEVSHSLNRIYITTSNGLYILNLTSLAIAKHLTYPIDFTGTGLVLDNIHQKVIVGDIRQGISPPPVPRLLRYSVTSDPNTYEQDKSFIGTGDKHFSRIELSPDRSKLLYIWHSDELTNYRIWSLNPLTFTKDGEWNIGKQPIKAIFSMDGEILYGTNSDLEDCNLYIMNGVDYSFINKVDVPGSGGNIFAVNSDDSVITMYNCDESDYYKLKLFYLNTNDLKIQKSFPKGYGFYKMFKEMVKLGFHPYSF